MNYKNIILEFAIISLSITKCFSIDYIIDNPFKDIDIKANSNHYKYNSNAGEKKSSENVNQRKAICKFLNQRTRQSYFYDQKSFESNKSSKLGEAYSFDIQLKIRDPKTGCAVYLTKHRFNPLQGDTPGIIYFQENFMLHGKSGKIAYTIEIQSGYCNQQYFIESVKINILEAVINNMPWPKTLTKKKLSEALK